MRLSWSSLVLVLVVASMGVGAEDVQISVFAPQTFSRSTTLSLQLGSDQPYDLQSVQSLLSLSVDVKSFFGSGTPTLCVYFDQDTSTRICAPLQGNTVTFPISPISARLLTFELHGVTFFSGGSSTVGVIVGDVDVEITQIHWTGGAGATRVQSLASLRQVNAVKLGFVRDFVTLQGTNVAQVFSSDPRVVAWFNDSTHPGTGKTSTVNPADEVLVCANEDVNRDSAGNPICDFVDAAGCKSRGSEWLLGSCCGEGAYVNCQFYKDKQAMCGVDAQGRHKWAPLANVGTIVSLGTCPNVQVVSAGAKFFTCGDVPSGYSNIEKFQGKETLGGHDYVCQGTQLVECGGDSPFSASALHTGDRFTFLGKVNYCSASGAFKESFDGDQVSCEKTSGLVWTGSKCCGEVDDPMQSYEDPTGVGGCFNGQFVRSGATVGGVREAVNYKGEFYVCVPQTVSVSTVFANTSIVPKSASPCGTPLLGAASGSTPHMLCTPGGSWRFTDKSEVHYVKSVPWQVRAGQDKLGCCPQGQCWDGVICKNRGEVLLIEGQGFRCQ